MLIRLLLSTTGHCKSTIKACGNVLTVKALTIVDAYLAPTVYLPSMNLIAFQEFLEADLSGRPCVSAAFANLSSEG